MPPIGRRVFRTKPSDTTACAQSIATIGASAFTRLFAGDAVAAGEQEVEDGRVHCANELLLELLVLLLHLCEQTSWTASGMWPSEQSGIHRVYHEPRPGSEEHK